MLRSTLSSLREYLTPISNESNFQETGQLTPDEFVKAGDYLVYKFPTWSWSAASKNKRKDFLPENKQFLVTKHVPCAQRANEDMPQDLELIEDENDAWLIGGQVSYDSIKGSNPNVNKPPSPQNEQPTDLEDLESLGIAEDNVDENVNATNRSYNVYITYSTSYRVPKAYLSGYDSNGSPLVPKLMFDDIVGDYKHKTVTIEQAPFQDNLTLISIHPCKHAGVMRMLLDMANSRAVEVTESEGEWEEVPRGLSVDQYLVVFLKFIASVTPTIEYDFTMAL